MLFFYDSFQGKGDFDQGITLTYRQFDEQMKDPAARAAFTAAVEQGRQDIAAGRFIEHDDLDAELDRILKAAAQPK